MVVLVVDMVGDIRLVVTKVETMAKGMVARTVNLVVLTAKVVDKLVVVRVVTAKVVDSLVVVKVVTAKVVGSLGIKVVPGINLASKGLGPGLEVRVTTGNLLATLSPLLECSMPPTREMRGVVCVGPLRLGETLPTYTRTTGPTMPRDALASLL